MLTSKCSFDIFVSKLDSNGNLVRTRIMGDAAFDGGNQFNLGNISYKEVRADAFSPRTRTKTCMGMDTMTQHFPNDRYSW